MCIYITNEKEGNMVHKTLWHTIELLAYKNGLSCSGLARLSGLDATTFNKSKQFAPDGTPRWPSCSTIAKIIDATHINLYDFAKIYTIAENNIKTKNNNVLHDK